MIAAVALDEAHVEEEPPALTEAVVPRQFETIDPLTSLIDRLNQEIERRDDQLDDPFVLVITRRSTVPLALCGTRTRAPCDEFHAGRCRANCASQNREWRAELDAAASGRSGRSSYELVYDLRWMSDWYRD